MKWRNVDTGEGYYYITGTIVEWLPLLARDTIRRAVAHEIKIAAERFGAAIAAYVLMPDHIHVLIYLPSADTLHRFCKCWRGRSARRVIDVLRREQDAAALEVLARHADARCQYAAWKEQVRALPIYTWHKLVSKIEYIHANPVRRGLVEVPEQWPHSSCAFYDRQEPGLLPVVPPEP